MHAWAEFCHLLQSSKSPLTGFLCSIGWRTLRTPHTDSISNSAIMRNNYISLLSDLCTCVHVKKNGVIKEAIVLQWEVSLVPRPKTIVKESCKFEVARLKKKKKKKKKERKKIILAVWQLSGLVLLWGLLAPLGMLFVMKTLEDER